MDTRKKLGLEAEAKACQFLQHHGLELLERNYQCRQGEIDLIMQDRDEIVFVEVRLRNNTACGDAFDSITYTKQRKIIQAANFYLAQNQIADEVNCRFDVIGLSYANPESAIDWIKDAFVIENF